jgi:hypothetical protein
MNKVALDSRSQVHLRLVSKEDDNSSVELFLDIPDDAEVLRALIAEAEARLRCGPRLNPPGPERRTPILKIRPLFRVRRFKIRAPECFLLGFRSSALPPTATSSLAQPIGRPIRFSGEVSAICKKW